MINASFEFTKDAINEKLKSPFWRNFIIAWITWNWKVWYVTFFVSEEKVGNKIEYIKNMYSYFDFYNLFPFLGFIIHWLFFPLLITYLMVYYIPKKIIHKFDREEQENIKRRNILLAEEIKNETAVIKAQKENLEKKEEIEGIKKEKYREEYSKFKKTEYFKIFPDIVIISQLGDNYSFLNNTQKKYFEINEITTYNQSLTEKGKSFLRYFYEEDGAGKILNEKEDKLKKEFQDQINSLPF